MKRITAPGLSVFLKSFAALACLVATTVPAEVSLPNIFGDHMVLQRDHRNPVWGWAQPGEKVSVSIAGQSHETRANDEGDWKVKLDPLQAGGPHKLTVKGENTVAFEDVLVGEVWVCSGQSNMAWPVSNSVNADLEIRTAKHPNLRIVSVPQVGTQEPRKNFEGKWEAATSENVGSFSAVGYYFGRQLHQTLDVPVGLIDNAWGGSSAEAWVRRDLLQKDDRYAALLERWQQTEKTYDHEKAVAAYQDRLKKWQEAAKQARAEKKTPPNRPRAPRNPLTGQHRPANLYNGVLKPIMGYGIRGAIWYQGESNAGRAYQYRHLFPLMIRNWRDDWGQGEFPFYWVQLADFRNESADPQESAWAELREAQTLTMSQLKHTGEAVIIDAGEGRDIHPRDKQTVAMRLARWPLATLYGVDVPYRSPAFESMAVNGNKATLTFDHVGKGLYTFDVPKPVGFAVAGEDKVFHWAEGRLVGNNQVEVWSDAVKNPVAVRYAWADNPVCNLYSRDGLPATPFRTDDWPGVTIDSHK